MFHLALVDFFLSVSMFQEFRRRIFQLAAIKYQPGQVITAFFIGYVYLSFNYYAGSIMFCCNAAAVSFFFFFSTRNLGDPSADCYKILLHVRK